MKKIPNAKIFVLYHANCQDGFGAAFAAWLHFRDKLPAQAMEFIPVRYGEPPPKLPPGPKKMACVAFHPLGRNRRSVWTVPKSRMSGDHLAPFPEELVRPCILAGCPEGGVVLDPFAGSGTTGRVALRTRRQAVLIELNPEYIPLIRERCSGFTPELL